MSATFAIVRMLAFSIAAALLTTQLIFVDGAATTQGGYLTCASCIASDLKCDRSCLGKWCYKAVLSTKDSSDVKRGCLNQTDDEISIGCQRKGDEIASEMFCICNDKMRCNSAAVGSPLLSTVFVLSALAARILFT